VQLDALKPFLPEKAAGLPRTSQSSDRSGVAGLMVAKVHSDYGDQSGKSLSLEVVDTGGVSGLTGLAGWAMLGASSEKENDSQIERTRKDGNRMVHEQISKKGGTNEYTVVLGDRFVVTGRGTGVDFDGVKGAVTSLDLGKIESLK
jgi:glycine cleavage system protein P-like pyridoxal-binding family